MIHGILNIYKPKGFTSHDVVAKARGILREKKIGHTGTLDPEAEGVLPLCIGKATKVVPYLTEADKCYEAEVILGAYTTTEDSTGEVLETFEVNVSKEAIQNTVLSFKGEYVQIPPMYSAIKVKGVRLYELARKGLVVDRPERKVHIYDIEIIEWLENNRFRIRVHCSKGTYIRTLCTDIGKRLECGAHMGKLLRTKVGQYTLEQSITLQELEEHKEEALKKLYSLEDVFKEYPVGYVKKEALSYLYNGNPLKCSDVSMEQIFKEAFIRLYDNEKRFIALYKKEGEDLLKVEKMFFNELSIKNGSPK